MEENWILDPINEEFIGWNILSENSTEGHLSPVAVVLVDNDLEKSKNNAALISAAPDLLRISKELLDNMNSNHPMYKDLSYIIAKAEGRQGDLEILNCFDDFNLNVEEEAESVINIDFKSNKCTYVSNAKMSEVFSYQSFGDNIGLLVLNLSTENNFEDVDEQSLIYPVGHLISHSVYNDFIEYLSGIYGKLKDFMSDFDRQDEGLSLRGFINNLFFDDFANNYIREITLEEYLDEYPLVHDTEELYIELNLPNFLEDCAHSLHGDIEVTYNGQTVSGIIFYIEKENKFYIFNHEDKSVSFFMIPNDDLSKQSTKLKYIDLIKSSKR